MTEESQALNAEELAFYYEEMVRSGLVELEVETPHGKVVLRRAQKHGNSGPEARMPLRRKTDFAPAITEPAVPAPAASPTINSPITGIFYRSASPQSPPLVKEGESVEAGTTLCIVEAMKVMNEIKAESGCKITKILAQNGKPVAKGQALFQIAG